MDYYPYLQYTNRFAFSAFESSDPQTRKNFVKKITSNGLS